MPKELVRDHDCPEELAIDKEGNALLVDAHNHCIRKISPEGVVTTLAGSGEEGYADGTGAAASFAYPRGVIVDSEGDVIVADTDNQRIRKISAEGVVTTLAGSGEKSDRRTVALPTRCSAPRGFT